MFIPNYNLINRYANARVNGYSDEQFESMMKENYSNGFDHTVDKYNSQPRLESCMSEIVEEPDTTTNVNTFGDQKDYNREMTNNLNNNNFTQVKQNREQFENTANDYREMVPPKMKSVSRPQYYHPPVNANNRINRNALDYKCSFFDGALVIDNKTIVILAIVILIILSFSIVIGVISHRNIILRNKLENLETRMNMEHINNPRVIVSSPPYINKPMDRQSTYEDKTENTLMSRPLQVSPQTPIYNGVL